MKRLTIIASLALGALSACETGIDVPVALPAQSQEAANLRNIVVLDYQGSDGAGFAQALEAALSGATFDGARYFNVTSRQALSGMTGISGASDRAIAAAINIGSQLGVDGVYFGDITQVDFDQTSSRVERSRCIEFDGPFDCEKREKYMTTCYNSVATYTAVPKIASVATGQVVYSNTFTGSRTGYHCDGDVTVAKDRDTLLAEARSDVLDQVRKAVAPRNEQAKVDLEESASLGGPGDQELFDGAVAFAKAGRMDRACGSWEVLLDKYPTVFEVVYNTAVCAEVSGDFSRAIDMYTQLDAGLTSPNPKVSKALTRVKGQLNATSF
ncbi:MAG: hypothetical protein AAGJ32_10240 [Pseudomonadota bacterium]